LINDFSGEDIAFGNLLQTFVGAGVDPAVAIQRTEEALSRSQRDHQSIKADYNSLTQRSTNTSFLADKLQGHWIYRSLPRPTPIVSPSLEADFDTVAFSDYARHGNLEAARKTALDTVRKIGASPTSIVSQDLCAILRSFFMEHQG